MLVSIYFFSVSDIVCTNTVFTPNIAGSPIITDYNMMLRAIWRFITA